MAEIFKTYAAYGLNINSEISLADLLPGNSCLTDVSMRFGHLKPELIDAELRGARDFEYSGVKIRATKNVMYFDWERLGKVLVREGREVIADPDDCTLEEDFQPFLTGPVLAVLLHQRGHFVLHSSAVEIDGAAVAFLGAKGFGKSTLAGFLAKKGCRFISDDILPITYKSGKAMTMPGFPRIKLYDNAIKAIGENPSDYPKIHRFVEKRSFYPDEPFQTESVQLNAAYILGDGEKAEIKEINPVDAFIEISKNTHLNRYMEALQCRREYFEHCRKFIKAVPVFHLRRHSDLGAMDEIAEKLEKHAGTYAKKNIWTEKHMTNGFYSIVTNATALAQ